MIHAPLRNGYKGLKDTWCNKKSGNNCIRLFLEEGQKGTTRPGSTRKLNGCQPPGMNIQSGFHFQTQRKENQSVGQTKKDGSQMKVKGQVNFGPKQLCIPSASKAKGKGSVVDLDGSKEEEEGSSIEDSSSFAADSNVVFGEETEGATFNHKNAKE
ncbi:hypothetical protein M9H77_18855 [Catharanthus roseus]|uniref:Uncharacterized protein n=1 Tax=Catharanthus roseus TaxID=4058 RepID=A0ACC0B8K8_CATRO|nr:hypothetical protein M9H77_18855 [Catharanthus roseus]